MEVIAEKSKHQKCERCWYHQADCEYNTYFEGTLCKRCVTVLCQLEAQGKWLRCPACTEWFCDEKCTPADINDNYICPICLKEMIK
jgi:hypothetical protein